MPESSNLYGVILALVSSIGTGAWFWYDKKEKDKAFVNLTKKVENVSDKQIEQENKFVTEPRTREILKEELEVLKKDVSEVKQHVSNINTNLSGLVADIRVITAVQDLINNGKVK